MTYALPALLVGLTALVTSTLVHTAYAVLWLSHVASRGPTPYDWNGALTVSGIASAMVLVAGLMVRRLAAGNATRGPAAPEAVPVRIVARSDR